MEFKKLSKRQQKALLEKYRDVNVDDGRWYSSIYDDEEVDELLDVA